MVRHTLWFSVEWGCGQAHSVVQCRVEAVVQCRVEAVVQCRVEAVVQC